MKPVFEFLDYRKYMQTFYDERKRLSAFSWKKFSRIAGFSSSNYMKLVCDGKSRLSKVGVEQVAVAMVAALLRKTKTLRHSGAKR